MSRGWEFCYFKTNLGSLSRPWHKITLKIKLIQRNQTYFYEASGFINWDDVILILDLLIFQLVMDRLLLVMGKLAPSSRGVYLIRSPQIKCFLSMLANVWSPGVVGVRSAASISGELFKLCWINRTCNVNVNMNNCVERRHQVKLWLELKAWSWLAKLSSQALIMQIIKRNRSKKNIHLDKY